MPFWVAGRLRAPFAALKGGAFRKTVTLLLERAGLPGVRFHDLRHTAATLLLGQGMHSKVVADILGHATIAITLDLYSQATPATHRQAAQAMDAVLQG